MTKARDIANQAPLANVASVSGAVGAVLLKTLNGASLTGAGNIALDSSIQYSGRTLNTALAAADKGFFIDITIGAGNFSLAFAAAATLGSGWFVYLRNSGLADLTLTPNGAERMDSLTSYVMYPGEVRLIQCDGLALRSVVMTAFAKTFITSGTFVTPPGYSYFSGRAWSAGTSGERTQAVAQVSRGGGGGGCGDFVIQQSLFGATQAVTIGAGGAPITGIGIGMLGGDTSLGGLFSVFGAKVAHTGGCVKAGGVAISIGVANQGNHINGFEGANAEGGSINTFMGGSGPAMNGAEASGSSVYGGAAGGSLSGAAVVRSPGTSTYGGGGGAAASTSNGSAGAAPGGGGGATQTGTQSGAGARGELRIWGIA